MTVRKSYYPYLDGLRAAAALYVVMCHMITEFKFNDLYNYPLLKKYSVLVFSNGVLAVDFFIVVSGFCLAIPMINSNSFRLKNGPLSFYYQRYKRIYLPYLFATIFSVFLIAVAIGNKTGTHWDLSIPVTKVDIIRHLLLIQDIFYSSCDKINHAFWSISVECRIYLFFPLIILIWRYYGPLVTLCGSILLSAALLLITVELNRFNKDFNIDVEGVNPYIILFVLGMIGSYAAFSHETKLVTFRQNAPWWLIILILGIAVLTTQRLALHGHFPYFFELTDLLAGCCSVCILIAINEGKYYLHKLFSFRPLVIVGSFAYSIYLIHAPFIQLIWQRTCIY